MLKFLVRTWIFLALQSFEVKSTYQLGQPEICLAYEVTDYHGTPLVDSDVQIKIMVILNHVQNKYRTANNRLKTGELPIQLGREFFENDSPQKLIYTLQANDENKVCKTAEYPFIDYQNPVLAIGFNQEGSDSGHTDECLFHYAKIEISNFCREANKPDTRFHPYYNVCPRNDNEEFVTYCDPRNEFSCDHETQKVTGGFCPISLVAQPPILQLNRSESAYFFSSDCNRGAYGANNIIGLYDAGVHSPYRTDNSVLANIDLTNGYSSNTAQTLQLVTDDAPVDYSWAATFDYCLQQQDPSLGWDQPDNGLINWFGFDTYPQLLNGKVITVSFNFKFKDSTPPTQNIKGHGMGLKIAGVEYSDWFGANDECVGSWCRFEETLTLTSTEDEQKIIFFWNQVTNGDDWGCFFRFNDFKVSYIN